MRNAGRWRFAGAPFAAAPYARGSLAPAAEILRRTESATVRAAARATTTSAIDAMAPSPVCGRDALVAALFVVGVVGVSGVSPDGVPGVSRKFLADG